MAKTTTTRHPAPRKKTTTAKAPRAARAPRAPRTPKTPKVPKAPRVKQPAAAESPAYKLAMEVAKLGLEKKATDVVVLDVRGLASYAEFFVVMTAESDPQLNAIADHVDATMKEKGERPVSIEGARGGRWVLMDFGDVVVHLFYQDTREFYDIEGLWADAERTPVKD